VAAVNDVSVTTPEDNCLAVNIIGVVDDNAVNSFVGQTGGLWFKSTPESLDAALTPDQCIVVQIAEMASPGTINGGSTTMAAADPWATVGFYVRPPAASPPATDTGDFFAFI
jgi:hypothetical protein